jgi:hypothetical protein
MAASNAFRFRSMVLLLTLPALLVGAALWILGSLVPGCSVDEQARLGSPDGRFDLVIFSRSCGPSTAPNTQAALLPLGDDVPDDAASFLIIGEKVTLSARWNTPASLQIALPLPTDIRRQDASVAGIAVTYD